MGLEVDIVAPDVKPFAADVEATGVALGDLTTPSQEAATYVLGDVKAPYRTGLLDSTVEAVVTPLGFTLTAGGTRAPYAAIVHARDPFLTRALEGREEDVIDTYADHVENTIDKNL